MQYIAIFTTMKRYLYENIVKDLSRKMVFLTGPRQVGKTYLAKQIMQEYQNSIYLNYDDITHQKIIKEQTWQRDVELLIFDEIHKMPNWKNYIKGVFDTKSTNQKILVTGSARLETFRKSGDSLAGRYFHYRLNPITIDEVKNDASTYSILKNLNNFGGFPEPFFNSINLNEDEAKVELSRWQNQYYSSLIREDILDFSRIQEISTIKYLLELLRVRVGSPISVSGLAEDLQKSPNTIKKYIEILESLYIIFVIRPFHKKINRALLKEPKVYFYDTSFVKGNEGIQLENNIAVSLLKYSQFKHDVEGKNIELQYVKTKDKQEVDFVLVENEVAKTFVESKLSEKKISGHLVYFQSKFPDSEFIQLVQNLRINEDINGIKLRIADEWLSNLENYKLYNNII
jgi:predicted AAA+ superfamily ATPase